DELEKISNDNKIKNSLEMHKFIVALKTALDNNQSLQAVGSKKDNGGNSNWQKRKKLINEIRSQIEELNLFRKFYKTLKIILKSYNSNEEMSEELFEWIQYSLIDISQEFGYGVKDKKETISIYLEEIIEQNDQGNFSESKIDLIYTTDLVYEHAKKLKNIIKNVQRGEFKKAMQSVDQRNEHFLKRINDIFLSLSGETETSTLEMTWGLLSSKELTPYFKEPEFAKLKQDIGYFTKLYDDGEIEKAKEVLSVAKIIVEESQKLNYFTRQVVHLFASKNLNKIETPLREVFNRQFSEFLAKANLNKNSPRASFYWTFFFRFFFISLEISNPRKKSQKIINPLFKALTDLLINKISKGLSNQSGIEQADILLELENKYSLNEMDIKLFRDSAYQDIKISEISDNGGSKDKPEQEEELSTEESGWLEDVQFTWKKNLLERAGFVNVEYVGVQNLDYDSTLKFVSLINNYPKLKQLIQTNIIDLGHGRILKQYMSLSAKQLSVIGNFIEENEDILDIAFDFSKRNSDTIAMGETNFLCQLNYRLPEIAKEDENIFELDIKLSELVNFLNTELSYRANNYANSESEFITYLIRDGLGKSKARIVSEFIRILLKQEDIEAIALVGLDFGPNMEIIPIRYLNKPSRDAVKFDIAEVASKFKKLFDQNTILISKNKIIKEVFELEIKSKRVFLVLENEMDNGGTKDKDRRSLNDRRVSGNSRRAKNGRNKTLSREIYRELFRATDNLGQFFNQLITTSLEWTGAESGAILLFTSDQNYMYLTATAGKYDYELEDSFLLEDKSLISIAITAAVAEGKPFYYTNSKKDNLLKSTYIKSSQMHKVNSVLYAPLRVDDTFIGMMEIVNRNDGQFNRENTLVVAEIIEIASKAIKMASLNEKNVNHVFNTAEALVAALEVKDYYTRGHSERVGKMSKDLGRKLGLSSSDIDQLSLAALLHDIGKIGIPEVILNKPGKFDDEEFINMKRHSSISAELLVNSNFRQTKIISIIRQHHERIDGKGYPDGLKGKDIHLYSRIISLADVYDALTSFRVYHSRRFTQEEAFKIIQEGAGTQFDSDLVSKFISTISEGNNSALALDRLVDDALLIGEKESQKAIDLINEIENSQAISIKRTKDFKEIKSRLSCAGIINLNKTFLQQSLNDLIAGFIAQGDADAVISKTLTSQESIIAVQLRKVGVDVNRFRPLYFVGGIEANNPDRFNRLFFDAYQDIVINRQNTIIFEVSRNRLIISPTRISWKVESESDPSLRIRGVRLIIRLKHDNGKNNNEDNGGIESDENIQEKVRKGFEKGMLDSIIFIDIDLMKLTNEYISKANADIVLNKLQENIVKVVNRLNKKGIMRILGLKRNNAESFRRGGDEFVLAVNTGGNTEVSFGIAKEIKAAVEGSYFAVGSLGEQIPDSVADIVEGDGKNVEAVGKKFILITPFRHDEKFGFKHNGRGELKESIYEINAATSQKNIFLHGSWLDSKAIGNKVNFTLSIGVANTSEFSILSTKGDDLYERTHNLAAKRKDDSKDQFKESGHGHIESMSSFGAEDKEGESILISHDAGKDVGLFNNLQDTANRLERNGFIGGAIPFTLPVARYYSDQKVFRKAIASTQDQSLDSKIYKMVIKTAGKVALDFNGAIVFSVQLLGYYDINHKIERLLNDYFKENGAVKDNRFDIADFKVVNEAIGYRAGDQAIARLRAIAIRYHKLYEDFVVIFTRGPPAGPVGILIPVTERGQNMSDKEINKLFIEYLKFIRSVFNLGMILKADHARIIWDKFNSSLEPVGAVLERIYKTRQVHEYNTSHKIVKHKSIKYTKSIESKWPELEERIAFEAALSLDVLQKKWIKNAKAKKIDEEKDNGGKNETKQFRIRQLIDVLEEIRLEKIEREWQDLYEEEIRLKRIQHEWQSLYDKEIFLLIKYSRKFRMLAHEINNILGVIMGYSDLINNDGGHWLVDIINNVQFSPVYKIRDYMRVAAAIAQNRDEILNEGFVELRRHYIRKNPNNEQQLPVTYTDYQEQIDWINNKVSIDMVSVIKKIEALTKKAKDQGLDKMGTEKSLSTIVNRLVKLFQDLQKWQDTKDGLNIELDNDVFCLREMVEGSIDKFQKGLNVIFRSKPEEARVLINREDFTYIFSDLLTNAEKHASAGVEPYVEVDLFSVDSKALLVVKNNGDQVPEKDLEEIFKPGVRLNPDKTHGTGSGLSFLSDQVKELGGRAWAENWPRYQETDENSQNGIAINIELPLYESPEEDNDNGGSDNQAKQYIETLIEEINLIEPGNRKRIGFEVSLIADIFVSIDQCFRTGNPTKAKEIIITAIKGKTPCIGSKEVKEWISQCFKENKLDIDKLETDKGWLGAAKDIIVTVIKEKVTGITTKEIKKLINKLLKEWQVRLAGEIIVTAIKEKVTGITTKEIKKWINECLEKKLPTVAGEIIVTTIKEKIVGISGEEIKDWINRISKDWNFILATKVAIVAIKEGIPGISSKIVKEIIAQCFERKNSGVSKEIIVIAIKEKITGIENKDLKIWISKFSQQDRLNFAAEIMVIAIKEEVPGITSEDKDEWRQDTFREFKLSLVEETPTISIKEKVLGMSSKDLKEWIDQLFEEWKMTLVKESIVTAIEERIVDISGKDLKKWTNRCFERDEPGIAGKLLITYIKRIGKLSQETGKITDILKNRNILAKVDVLLLIQAIGYALENDYLENLQKVLLDFIRYPQVYKVFLSQNPIAMLSLFVFMRNRNLVDDDIFKGRGKEHFVELYNNVYPYIFRGILPSSIDITDGRINSLLRQITRFNISKHARPDLSFEGIYNEYKNDYLAGKVKPLPENIPAPQIIEVKTKKTTAFTADVQQYYGNLMESIKQALLAIDDKNKGHPLYAVALNELRVAIATQLSVLNSVVDKNNLPEKIREFKIKEIKILEEIRDSLSSLVTSSVCPIFSLSFKQLKAIYNIKTIIPIVRTMLFIHAFENNSNWKDYFRGNFQEQVSLSVITEIIRFIDNFVVSHLLDGTEIEFRKELMKYVNISIFREELKRVDIEKTGSTQRIKIYPTRGWLAEFLGYYSDICWTSSTGIIRGNPDMIALVFVDEETSDILGGTLLMPNSVEGRMVLIDRGLSPRNSVTENLDAQNIFVEKVTDYEEKIANSLGAEKIVVPLRKLGIGLGTVNPDIIQYYERVVGDKIPVVLDADSVFNNQDITSEKCVVFREWSNENDNGGIYFNNSLLLDKGNISLNTAYGVFDKYRSFVELFTEDLFKKHLLDKHFEEFNQAFSFSLLHGIYNAMIHGNGFDEDKIISINWEITGKRVVFNIEDEGSEEIDRESDDRKVVIWNQEIISGLGEALFHIDSYLDYTELKPIRDSNGNKLGAVLRLVKEFEQFDNGGKKINNDKLLDIRSDARLILGCSRRKILGVFEYLYGNGWLTDKYFKDQSTDLLDKCIDKINRAHSKKSVVKPVKVFFNKIYKYTELLYKNQQLSERGLRVLKGSLDGEYLHFNEMLKLFKLNEDGNSLDNGGVDHNSRAIILSNDLSGLNNTEILDKKNEVFILRVFKRGYIVHINIYRKKDDLYVGVVPLIGALDSEIEVDYVAMKKDSNGQNFQDRGLMTGVLRRLRNEMAKGAKISSFILNTETRNLLNNNEPAETALSWKSLKTAGFVGIEINGNRQNGYKISAKVSLDNGGRESKSDRLSALNGAKINDKEAVVYYLNVVTEHLEKIEIFRENDNAFVGNIYLSGFSCKILALGSATIKNGFKNRGICAQAIKTLRNIMEAGQGISFRSECVYTNISLMKGNPVENTLWGKILKRAGFVDIKSNYIPFTGHVLSAKVTLDNGGLFSKKSFIPSEVFSLPLCGWMGAKVSLGIFNMNKALFNSIFSNKSPPSSEKLSTISASFFLPIYISQFNKLTVDNGGLINRKLIIETSQFVLYHFLVLSVGSIFYLLYPVKVIGRKKLPKNESFIIAANHFFYLDCILMMLAVFPRRLTILTHSYVYDPLKILFKIFGIGIKVNPNQKDLRRVIREVSAAADKGRVIAIFPEGEVSREGRLLDFYPGISLFSQVVGIKVFPLAIKGTYEIWPRTKHFPNPRKLFYPVEVEISNPLSYSKKRIKDISRESLVEETNKIRESINNLLEKDSFIYKENLEKIGNGLAFSTFSRSDLDYVAKFDIRLFSRVVRSIYYIGSLISNPAYFAHYPKNLEKRLDGLVLAYRHKDVALRGKKTTVVIQEKAEKIFLDER
ncbi:MAG: HD domain-containing protein, partial [Parcubacteria group bacterium]|nr:HD domain-containing protein [Parcubacteria group bacterium]